MSQQNDAVKSVFDRAAECESAEHRKAYLDDACAGNRELRSRVESLLEAYDQAGEFLENRPVNFVVHPSEACAV